MKIVERDSFEWYSLSFPAYFSFCLHIFRHIFTSFQELEDQVKELEDREVSAKDEASVLYQQLQEVNENMNVSSHDPIRSVVKTLFDSAKRY